jgi:hypothetical protein
MASLRTAGNPDQIRRLSNVGKISLTSIKADAQNYAAKHNVKSQIKKLKIKQRTDARVDRVSGGRKVRQKKWLAHIIVIRAGIIWQRSECQSGACVLLGELCTHLCTQYSHFPIHHHRSTIVRCALRIVIQVRCFKRKFAAKVARTFLSTIMPLDRTADLLKGKFMRAW